MDEQENSERHCCGRWIQIQTIFIAFLVNIQQQKVSNSFSINPRIQLKIISLQMSSENMSWKKIPEIQHEWNIN